MQIFHLYAELLFNFHLWGYNVICPELSRALQKSGQKAICDWVVTSCLCFFSGWKGEVWHPRQAAGIGHPPSMPGWPRGHPFSPCPQTKRTQLLVEMHPVCSDRPKYLPQRGSSQGNPNIDLGAITGSLQAIKMQRSHWLPPPMGGPGSLRWFTNSKANSEEEMECNSYLLVDIIIPAEVSSPPWKHMDMNMLEMWNKIMVIIKFMTFFSELSALFSTHTSNCAQAPTALFSEENTLTCSITASQLFGEYKRWKTWESSPGVLYELRSEMPGSLGGLWNYS